MASGLLLAFLAGLVTILNPCVLPLVPILIGSALGTSPPGRWRWANVARPSRRWLAMASRCSARRW